MALANWNTEEDWDFVVIGGERMPGVAYVSVDIQSGLDAPKPKGGKRPPIRDEGEPPAKIAIELVMTYEEAQDLQRHRAILRPKGKGGARDPQSIVHPNTMFWGIRNISIGNVSSPMPGAGGFWRLKIDALEWTRKPEKVKKPKEKPKDDDADAWAPFVDGPTEALAASLAEAGAGAQTAILANSLGIAPVPPSKSDAGAQNF